MTKWEKFAFGTLALVFIALLCLHFLTSKFLKGSAMHKIARLMLVAVIIASGVAFTGCARQDAQYLGCLLRDNSSHPCQ